LAIWQCELDFGEWIIWQCELGFFAKANKIAIQQCGLGNQEMSTWQNSK